MSGDMIRPRSRRRASRRRHENFKILYKIHDVEKQKLYFIEFINFNLQ